MYVARITHGIYTNASLVYYGTQYFTNAGFQNPFTIQIITNAVNIASTFPGLYMVRNPRVQKSIFPTLEDMA